MRRLQKQTTKLLITVLLIVGTLPYTIACAKSANLQTPASSTTITHLPIKTTTSTQIPTPNVSKPVIPNYFTTYTDEKRTFSISCPSSWKTFPTELWSSTLEQIRLNFLQYYNSSAFLTGYFIVFVAESATGGPNVVITVQPLSDMISQGNETLDEIVAAESKRNKQGISGYRELSQTTTSVNNIPARLLEGETSSSGGATGKYVQMFIIKDKFIWKETFVVNSLQFDSNANDLYTIINNLQILR